MEAAVTYPTENSDNEILKSKLLFGARAAKSLQFCQTFPCVPFQASAEAVLIISFPLPFTLESFVLRV
jgi:hypothetical protein